MNDNYKLHQVWVYVLIDGVLNMHSTCIYHLFADYYNKMPNSHNNAAIGEVDEEGKRQAWANEYLWSSVMCVHGSRCIKG